MIKKTEKAEPTLLRRINRQQILSCLLKRGALSQKDIRRYVNLSKVSIASIVKELKDKKLLLAAGKEENSSGGGPKAELLKINPAYGLVAGIEYGDSCRAALFDTAMKPRYSIEVDNSEDSNAGDVVSTVKKALYKLFDKSKVSREKFLYAGVGLPGKVDLDSGRWIYFPRMALRDFPIGERLTEVLDVPVCVASNTRLMALAERSFDRKSVSESVVYLNVDRGLGAALIFGDRMHPGKDRMAGEIGHITIDPNGPLCPCGKRGCLQMFVSEQGLLKRFSEMLLKGCMSVLEPDAVNVERIFAAAKEGDPLSVELVDDLLRSLAFAVEMTVNLLDPDLLVLGGSVVEKYGINLAEEVKARALPGILDSTGRNINIIESRMGRDAVMTGAAELALNRVLYQ